MPYVSRDSGGAISGVFVNPQPGYATEFLLESDASLIAFLNPPKVPSFLSRDLFTQFTVADYTAVKTAIASNDSLGLLWDSLKAQGDAPIMTNAARFLAGWSALTQVLGQPRMDAIAAALGIPATYP